MNSATKDHVFPKSKGGTNHDFNIVLACRQCNSAKDNNYPYYDINGKEVKPIKFSNFEIMLRNMPTLREEWKPFLHL
jgi:CRISPR/Cas system Type II protein with McrA/HNH and RuvC-like nuclease domain